MNPRTGQHPYTFKKRISVPVTMKYLLYLPEPYQTTKKSWPLMLYLHGAGERGEDLDRVKLHGPPKLIAEYNRQFPFIIVSPQCPEGEYWSSDISIIRLNILLNDIIARYRVDKSRIYGTGLSMGGFGTWRMAIEFPNRFAAIAPICGGGIPEKAYRIAKLPVWVFHGAKDKVVPIQKSIEMVQALKTVGNKVRFTIYPNAGHDSWTKTYNNPELYNWLLAHQLKNHK
ncbi:MAG: prolyl oligopeptidase family serine peptidase [bacterium]